MHRWLPLQEVMSRVRKFGYKVNDEEQQALNVLSRREALPCCHALQHEPVGSAAAGLRRPSDAPHPPLQHGYRWPPDSTAATQTFVSCTTYVVRAAGLLAWSGVWGTAASVGTYQVVRRMQPGAGRTAPPSSPSRQAPGPPATACRLIQ